MGLPALISTTPMRLPAGSRNMPRITTPGTTNWGWSIVPSAATTAFSAAVTSGTPR